MTQPPTNIIGDMRGVRKISIIVGECAVARNISVLFEQPKIIGNLGIIARGSLQQPLLEPGVGLIHRIALDDTSMYIRNYGCYVVRNRQSPKLVLFHPKV